MGNKIPRTYKLTDTIVRLLSELAGLPEYGNATRVIECLVWREALSRCMVKPSNGHADPAKSTVRKVKRSRR